MKKHMLSKQLLFACMQPAWPKDLPHLVILAKVGMHLEACCTSCHTWCVPSAATNHTRYSTCYHSGCHTGEVRYASRAYFPLLPYPLIYMRTNWLGWAASADPKVPQFWGDVMQRCIATISSQPHTDTFNRNS